MENDVCNDERFYLFRCYSWMLFYCWRLCISNIFLARQDMCICVWWQYGPVWSSQRFMTQYFFNECTINCLNIGSHELSWNSKRQKKIAAKCTRYGHEITSKLLTWRCCSFSDIIHAHLTHEMFFCSPCKERRRWNDLYERSVIYSSFIHCGLPCKFITIRCCCCELELNFLTIEIKMRLSLFRNEYFFGLSLCCFWTMINDFNFLLVLKRGYFHFEIEVSRCNF